MTLTDKERKMIFRTAYEMARKGILLPKLRKDSVIKQSSQTMHQKVMQTLSASLEAPSAQETVNTVKRFTE